MSSADHLQLNEHGELTKLGPSWACEQYGTAGHDYYTCPRCKANYNLWLIWIGALPMATA